MLSPQPKPRLRATEKRANRRVEAKIKRQVRAACVERDHYCRLGSRFWRDDFMVNTWTSDCDGESEWAHFDQYRRFKTRGKPAAERHTVQGSMMLCRKHHTDYDSGELAITALSERGADGPLEFKRT